MLAQESLLRPGFDALGNHRQAQAVHHRNHRARDRNIILIVRQVGDKRTIDLHAVDREALQVTELRIAAAEIIERHAHPDRLQFIEYGNRALGVSHDR